MKTESKIYRLLLEIVNDHDHESAREEIDRFRKMPTLNEAIKIAAESKRDDGTCYPHQRRVFSRPDAIPSATRILLTAEAKIGACTSFEQVRNLVGSLLADAFGIGELYCYDVSIRIGAYLRCLPKKIHLHAGVFQGAKLLGLPTERGFLNVSELPEPLQGFQPYEIEDMLCHLARAARLANRKAVLT